MKEIPRSPSEYFIRFLLSKQYLENPDSPEAEVGDVTGRFVPDDILRYLETLQLDGLNHQYIREVIASMLPFPTPFIPLDASHKASRAFLKTHKIYDMWHTTAAVIEAQQIVLDGYLREKLEPLLLSCLTPTQLIRRLRKYTSITLTISGLEAYGHYFWNRRLLSQGEWLRYLENRPNRNVYNQSLMTSPDLAVSHLPWVVGISGPSPTFNVAEAAARIGQIALKHALELEHKSATAETTMALRNCMVTIEKADQVMRRSDVALRDVLKQFQKFRMRVDDAKLLDVQQLTGGNFSKSGEGTDTPSDDDF